MCRREHQVQFRDGAFQWEMLPSRLQIWMPIISKRAELFFKPLQKLWVRRFKARIPGNSKFANGSIVWQYLWSHWSCRWYWFWYCIYFWNKSDFFRLQILSSRELVPSIFAPTILKCFEEKVSSLRNNWHPYLQPGWQHFPEKCATSNCYWSSRLHILKIN